MESMNVSNARDTVAKERTLIIKSNLYPSLIVEHRSYPRRGDRFVNIQLAPKLHYINATQDTLN